MGIDCFWPIEFQATALVAYRAVFKISEVVALPINGSDSETSPPAARRTGQRHTEKFIMLRLRHYAAAPQIAILGSGSV